MAGQFEHTQFNRGESVELHFEDGHVLAGEVLYDLGGRVHLLMEGVADKARLVKVISTPSLHGSLTKTLEGRELVPHTWFLLAALVVAAAFGILVSLAVQEGWLPLLEETTFPLPGEWFASVLALSSLAASGHGFWAALMRIWRHFTEGRSPDQRP